MSKRDSAGVVIYYIDEDGDPNILLGIQGFYLSENRGMFNSMKEKVKKYQTYTMIDKSLSPKQVFDERAKELSHDATEIVKKYENDMTVKVNFTDIIQNGNTFTTIFVIIEDRSKYTIPKGGKEKVDVDEIDNAKREAVEETGIVLDKKRFELIHSSGTKYKRFIYKYELTYDEVLNAMDIIDNRNNQNEGELIHIIFIKLKNIMNEYLNPFTQSSLIEFYHSFVPKHTPKSPKSPKRISKSPKPPKSPKRLPKSPKRFSKSPKRLLKPSK